MTKLKLQRSFPESTAKLRKELHNPDSTKTARKLIYGEIVKRKLRRNRND